MLISLNLSYNQDLQENTDNNFHSCTTHSYILPRTNHFSSYDLSSIEVMSTDLHLVVAMGYTAGSWCNATKNSLLCM